MSFFISVFGWAIALVIGVVSYNFFVARGIQKENARQKRDPVTGIKAGAEPVFLEGTRNEACLLVHGFIGSPTDFARLPKLLHEAGYSVSVPLLPGHGTHPEDLSRVSDEDLKAYVQKAYLDLKKKYARVILIGLSMGGALSVITAAKLQADGLILLAPYFKVKHQWYYLLPLSFYQNLLAPFVPYLYRMACFKQVFNKAAIPFIVDYNYVSSRGMETAGTIAGEAFRSFHEVRAPLLVVHSTEDRATDYQVSRKLFDASPVSHKEFLTLQKSNHLILWDFEAESAEQSILGFLSEL